LFQCYYYKVRQISILNFTLQLLESKQNIYIDVIINTCMNTEILQKLGLTPAEIQVYVELLKLGQSTSGSLIKVTNLQSSTTYHILDSLIQKGLVNYSKINSVKHYSSISPKDLKNIVKIKEDELKEQKEELNNLILNLDKINVSQIQKERSVEIYEGWNGTYLAFRKAYDQLEPGTKLYAYIITDMLGDVDFKQADIFIQKMAKLREEKNKGSNNKIHMYVIADKNSKLGKRQKNSKDTTVKYVESKQTNPMVINIYGNITILALWTKNPLMFLIESEEFANSFRNQFDLIWNSLK
jgi:DNA-binding MarR family transcriptional regulator